MGKVLTTSNINFPGPVNNYEILKIQFPVLLVDSAGLLHFTLADMSDVDPVNWQYLIQPIAFIGYDVNTVYSFAVKGSVVGTTTVGFTNFLTTNDEVLTPNTAGTAYYLDTDKKRLDS